jgi:hypothetical protein
VSRNRVLRKTVGPKMNEITWNWRRLHREVLNHSNVELNPICHLLALAGAPQFVDVSRIRVNDLYS